MAIAHPEIKIGRIDCSEEIVLSTRFIITKPPIFYHISPASRTLRPLPPEIGRPAKIVEYYDKKQWQQASPWLGALNPLQEGLATTVITYAGVVLKKYTNIVDRVP
jgi:hypothetical protein